MPAEERSTLLQMSTPSRLNNGRLAGIGDNGAGKPNYYGFGWYISEHRGHTVVLHPGDKPEYSFARGDRIIPIIRQDSCQLN